MKPGPAISTFSTSGLAGSAATSACASARGFVRAGLASASAAFVAKSPWSRLLVRSRTKAALASAGKVPALRRLSNACPIKVRSWSFTCCRGSKLAPIVRGTRPVALARHALVRAMS